jgi:alpha-D-ribose 1-methylphosphonate 5-triphosphate synthase subunit PhnL
LEELQFDIDFNLKKFYEDEIKKAIDSNNRDAVLEVIENAKQRGIDLNEEALD